MRYFPPVLVIIRFVAIALAGYATYAIATALIQYSPAVVPGNGFTDAIGFARHQALKGGITLGVFAAFIYFVAPLLARLITHGADPA